MPSWTPDLIQQHPLFSPILPALAPWLHKSQWPSLQEYNDLLQQCEVTHQNGLALRCIPPLNHTAPDAQYESRIYQRGEIQTRHPNWHDFFNLSVWMTFTASKSAMNHQQHLALAQRNNSQQKRSDIENALTLFDENGMIIISSDPALLELLKNFEWQKLFVEQRAAVEIHMRFLVIGHSIYEKALSPYIGMTASALLLAVDTPVADRTEADWVRFCDHKIANLIATNAIDHPQVLQPVPLLGIPTWDARNTQATFYENKDYFRENSRRRRTKVFITSTNKEKLIAK